MPHGKPLWQRRAAWCIGGEGQLSGLAEHGTLGGGVVADAADQPQQGVRVGRHGQALARASAGLAAKRQTDMALPTAQPLGPACANPGNSRQAFGVGLAGTGRVKAAEAPCLDAQRYRSPLSPADRQACGGIDCEAAQMIGRMWEGRRSLARGGVDDDGVRGRKDLVDGEPAKDQEQEALGQ